MSTEATFYDLEEIKQALAPRVDEFVLSLFPAAKKEASCFKIGNAQGEKGGSMMISTRANNPGYFIDFATGDKGKPWRLVSLAHGLSVKEGIKWLAKFLNLQPIQSFGNGSQAKDPEKLAKEVRALSKACIDYAASRGISHATLMKYGVGTDLQGKLAFPYYDAFGRLGMVKHWGLTPKPDGKKDTWVNAEPVMSLFGKDVCDPDTNIQRLIITEGECLSGDTQVLTPTGWIDLDVYTSMTQTPSVAQWENGKLSWVKPKALVVTSVDKTKWLSFKNSQFDLLVTPGHRMIYWDSKGNLAERTAKEWPKNAFKIPKTGVLEGTGISLSDSQIKLAIAVSSDAAIDKRKNTGPRKGASNRYARMAFSKERKINRIRKLLSDCSLKWSDNTNGEQNQSICFSLPEWIPGRLLPWSWIEDASLRQRKLILDELVHWDGNHVPNRKQKEYSSKYIENATWVQTLAATAGVSATIIKRKNEYGKWFKVSILHGKTHCTHQKLPDTTTGEETSYCLTVPSGAMLVRRNNKIVVTGNCDAMACFEAGLPAVSIPMGASNTNWITEDYQYLSHFDEIVLLFDNDQSGKEAAKTAQARLGAERCMIIHLPLKDANDMLKAGRAGEIAKIIDSTTPEPIAEIVDPSSMKENVRSYMKGEHLIDGDPFFLPSFDLSFRKHEITLWFGFTGHGKSQAVQNQIASLAAQGKMSCVASFEQPPELTFSQILTNFTAYPNLPFTDDYDPAFDHLSGLVFMYKSMERACPKHLVSTFIHAHKRYGIENFVIDNVMTMNIDRGDNTAQADAIDGLRVFVSKYPVHLHIVAHPRKPPENTAKPPGLSEIRGASEWGDMPHNIITVWRDMAKAERVAEMENDDYGDSEIKEFWNSTPCGKVLVRKQRLTGQLPMASFYFHKETKRFIAKPGEPRPMYSEIPWNHK